MRLRRPDEEGLELPLIPLIDMMFVLLIFFMVATTLKVMKPELPVSLPESDVAIESPDDETPTIGLDKNGNSFLDGSPVTTQALVIRLQELTKGNPNLAINLEIDREATYQQIIEVISTCHLQGLKNLRFRTRSPNAN